MAWTSPMTAVANAAFTAAQFNTHVRDNLLETAPGKATESGTYFTGNGANAIVERKVGLDFKTSTTETTTSTSYTDLATTGPTITVTTGTRAIVVISARMENNTAGQGCFVGYDISGAHTEAATDVNSLIFESDSAGQAMAASHVTMHTLTAGSNTFTAKYKVDGGTGSFSRRKIVVMPF